MQKLSVFSKAMTGALAAACWAHVVCGLLQTRPADCGSRTAEAGGYYYDAWQNSGWSQGGPLQQQQQQQHPTTDETAAVPGDDPRRPQWHHQHRTRHAGAAAGGQPAPQRPSPAAAMPEAAAAAVMDSDHLFSGDRGALQVHGQQWWSLVGAPGLLRLMFRQAAEWDAAASYGGLSSSSSALCGRVAAVGRLVARLAEPLFATGFFVAASYFFRTSLLPRLARRVHAYAATLMMRPDGGEYDDALSGRGGGDGGGSWPFVRLQDALAAGVRDAIDDDAARPCLQRMACEAGLHAANNPIAHSIRRMAERILLKSELSNIFNESFTGSVSECNQYSCEHE